MRRMITCLISTLLLLPALGQDNPVQYMSAINEAHVEMNKKYMAYMSAVAHSGRARKIEKLRKQALESINTSRSKVIEMPLYKGDNSLRKSSMDYIQICYNVFNEDYSKIVNMEEIAEQSFDEMQAYLLLQEKTEEKLQQAAQLINQATRSFAVKNNIRLTDGEKDELSEKMEAASKLNQYKNKLYLIFFKCNWQDDQISKAIAAKKLTNIEQSRNALLSYVNEGLASLGSIEKFNGDASLLITAKQVLMSYKKIAEVEMPKQIEFFLKQENFDKIKKNMEAKAQPTKEDVDNYNKAVKEMNNAVNSFNQSVKVINDLRAGLIEDWNNGNQRFLETHMPRYKA